MPWRRWNMLETSFGVAVANWKTSLCWVWKYLASSRRQFVSNPLAAIHSHTSVTSIGQIPGFGALDMATNLPPARWSLYSRFCWEISSSDWENPMSSYSRCLTTFPCCPIPTGRHDLLGYPLSCDEGVFRNRYINFLLWYWLRFFHRM